MLCFSVKSPATIYLQLSVIFSLFCQISFRVVRVLKARRFAKISSLGCEYRSGTEPMTLARLFVFFLKRTYVKKLSGKSVFPQAFHLFK